MKQLFLSTVLCLLAATSFATVVTVNASSTGTTTTTTKTSGTILVNNTTNRGYAVFNLASAGIPAAATISSVKVIFTYTISGASAPTDRIYGYAGDISSLSAAALYSGAVTSDQMYTASWGTTATTKTMASTAAADTFIQHNHTNTVSLTWVESASTRVYTITGGSSPQLQITYTCTTPSAVSITPSSNPLCSGVTETFTGNATGATTYSWSGPNSFASTLRNPAAFTTSTASAGVYTFSATSTCNITTTATLTLTVKTVPSAMGGSTTVCLGGTTLLTNTGIGGTWTKSNTKATVTSGGLVTGVTAGAVNITYSTGCGSAAVQAMTVRTTPAAITGTTNVCTGSTTALADATAGGTWSSSNTAAASVNGSGTVYGVGAGSATISYSLTNGCGSNVVTSPMTVALTGTWLGSSSNDWNDGANWPCATIPDATVNVVIPSGTTYLPSFAGATYDVKNLTINAGVSISIGSDATVAVHGSLTNNGTADGDGNVLMNGSAAQTMYGKGSFSNITVSNSNGVTINSTDTVRINGDFTLTAGTFTTNAGLRLLNTATRTGRIAQITGGTLSGNVTVDQYFPGGRRAFRFFAHPFSSAIALNQIISGLDISGSGGPSNGFTYTASNSASAFRYNTTIGNSAAGYDPGWRPFTSANAVSDTNAFARYQGIRMFVRGAKGEGLGYVPYTPSATIISMAGQLNTGTQVITLRKGTNSDYNMVGNPYASPTDIGAVIATEQAAGHVAGSAFYVWNPYLGAAGAYESKIIGGSYVLDMNTSFQVRAATDGTTLTFNESDKATTANEGLLRTAPSQFITLGVYDANNHGWDKMYVSFNNNASSNEDAQYDATKVTNPDLNFYSLAGDSKLAVDARPYSNSTIIPLGFTTSYAQQYVIKAENVTLPAGATLYLHDKMNNQYTLLTAGAEYRFDITGDKSTQGEARFELTANEGAAAISSKGLEVSMTPNPATDKVTIEYTADAKANTTVSVMNITGATVITKAMGNDASGKVTISLNELSAGIYMVEVASGDAKKVSKLVKE